MKIPDKGLFLSQNREVLEAMLENIMKSVPLDSSELPGDKTALVIIDMVNGFVKEGNLSSARIKDIVPSIHKTALNCSNRGFRLLAFADCHDENSAEFSCYPVHCMAGTKESELIDELKDIKNIELIKKNSTNGFLEGKFNEWLEKNKDINNFIVTGDCTDICVLQFCLTLRAHFNKNNKEINIIIPVDSVETFDIGTHNGDLMNVLSLFIMQADGAKIVSEIK